MEKKLKLPKEEERESEEVVVDKLSKSENDLFSSELETLIVPFDSEQQHEEILDVKPMMINTSTSLASLAPPHFKIEQCGMSHQEVLACVTAQAQAHMQVQAGHSCSLELLPVPIMQSLSSTISPCSLRQKSPTLHQDSKDCTTEVNQENSCDQKLELTHILVNSSTPDGYNWRKYGQKPVKSNDSSRSYYRCTHIDCHAKKKVERCDQSGHVVEIIYKGRHNHDPPQKIRRTKAKCLSTVGDISSPEPGEGSGPIDFSAREPDCSSPSTPRKEHIHTTPEQKLHCSSDCATDTIFKGEENCDQTQPKRRKSGSYPDTLCKTIKEPKIVVQASGEAGISGDGYRWRKYGQKMVKGNSHPRSYYKCTSAGCPVRKHVERARDDTTTIMITYEGKHDHDMPVPKKHQGPANHSLLTAAASAVNNAQIIECEALVNPKSPAEWSMDVEREVAEEKTPELRGEKALESARTLLSIGIELRPC